MEELRKRELIYFLLSTGNKIFLFSLIAFVFGRVAHLY
jgi:hypothetical protein